MQLQFTTLRPCSIPDCPKPSRTRTSPYCHTHYWRFRKYGDPLTFGPIRPWGAPVALRFWRFVDKTTTPDGCWPWIGSRNGQGYGHFKRPGPGASAHRCAYELQIGPIPEGHDVLHKCDNPPCQRGSHLFTGTHSDNMQDMLAKGRGNHPRKEHCPQGHPYDAINSYIRKKKGSRVCRECGKLRARNIRRLAR